MKDIYCESLLCISGNNGANIFTPHAQRERG